MRTFFNSRGQSLTELALLLPFIFVTTLIFLQLFLLARAKIVLGMVAQNTVYAESVGDSPAIAYALGVAHYFLPSLEQGAPGTFDVERPLLPEWRSYPGISTSKAKASLAHLTVHYGLFPRWIMGHFVSGKTLRSYTEALVEPAYEAN